MKFEIKNVEVFGLENAVIKSGNAMRTQIFNKVSEETYEKALKRMRTLGSAATGSGHDNPLKGIIVQFDIYAPLYWWKQAQRYHWFDFISSQSTMHCITKFDVRKQCSEYVWEETIDKLQKLINFYNEQENKDKEVWYEIIANIPSGFMLGASMTTNYQQLKTMYFQRKNHKLKEWKEFCDWCLTLPYFAEFIGIQNENINSGQ